MEPTRFDSLTKHLATGGLSRRRVLRALVGGVTGAVGLRRITGATSVTGACHAYCQPQAKQDRRACYDACLACNGITDQVCQGGGTFTCCGSDQTCLDDGSCCTPTTCEAQGVTCGTIDDGCGGTIQCGGCAGGDCNAPVCTNTAGVVCPNGTTYSSEGFCCATRLVLACCFGAGEQGFVGCCGDTEQECYDLFTSLGCSGGSLNSCEGT